MAVLAKILLALCIALPLIAADGANNLLDVEAPTFFNYNSPLRQPDSLRNRPYFDFLSTLYRRDAAKSDLFRPYYGRNRRAAPEQLVVPVASAAAADAAIAPAAVSERRPKRAIVFRPLFVYRQQQIKKQGVNTQRKRY